MDKRYNFKGDISKEDAHVHAEIFLVQFKEDDVFVIFAPALEIYGYGKTEKEAKSSFNVGFNEFVKYTINKGTFESELKRMGWIVKGSRKNKKYKTPAFSELLKNNERLGEIVNENPIKTLKKNLSLPIME